MNRFAHRARQLGLAVMFAAGSAASAQAGQLRDASAPEAASVTERDIAASNQEIASAYGALVNMWSADFQQLGVQFAPPKLLRYRGAVRTACGVMAGNNAEYCPSLNAIFFDEVFVAEQTREAARALGTDGDMVAVGIIAHEMGHAVAAQLDDWSDVPYENEAAADCLAGAFAQQSAKDGTLEKGDIEEAFFGLAAAADPTPRMTGNRRIDSRIALRMALMGHGTRDQRMGNFKAGYEGGPGACLGSFR
ncbi:MAG TPA: neutral zinc metallopeptidase [Gemmatimonadaceae bacterium]